MSGAEKYRAAGVDLDATDAAKARISRLVEHTRTGLTRGVAGAFGGMVAVPSGMRRPTLVMSTDGVGTKVLVAVRAKRHDTVGEDLVNHSVNDILVHGAMPIACLDYIAGAELSTDTITQLVEGVARGCRAHDMSLVGGETAQMPDLYPAGHYDLAGTIVGVVEEAKALHGDRVAVGDVLVGYASNGLHTNGYTLARRIVFDELGLDVGSDLADVGMTVGDALLAVHRSYYRAIFPALEHVHALAHVTGGGIAGNLVRSLPRGCGARIETAAWEVPPLFGVLQDAGDVSRNEMFRVFNMGVGMMAVTDAAAAERVRKSAEAAGVETFAIGEVVVGEEVRLE
jgi:phosphoribosylformylglycinamidine cyclo-ligase